MRIGGASALGVALLVAACGGQASGTASSAYGGGAGAASAASLGPGRDTGLAGGAGLGGVTQPPPVIPPFPDLCSNYTDNPYVRPYDCEGNCRSDEDCGGTPCTVLPGATGGVCSAFSPGLCLDDADCPSEWWPNNRCVAVTADGIRQCSRGEDQACNRDEHCSAGLRCSLPDASFLGHCTAGANRDLCARTADCQAGQRCFEQEPGKGVDPLNGAWGLCSDGSDGALCAANSDCRRGHCVALQCSSGGQESGCKLASDCQAGLHCVPWETPPDPRFPDVGSCSDGTRASLSHCITASHCANGHYCSHGMCMDGLEDAWCDADAQCTSGRCLVGGDYEMCTTGQPGSQCINAGDCVSGSCYRKPGLFEREAGVCQ